MFSTSYGYDLLLLSILERLGSGRGNPRSRRLQSGIEKVLCSVVRQEYRQKLKMDKCPTCKTTWCDSCAVSNSVAGLPYGAASGTTMTAMAASHSMHVSMSMHGTSARGGAVMAVGASRAAVSLMSPD